MRVTAMTGESGVIRFSEPMEFQRVLNAVCSTQTRCEFSGVTSPAEVEIDATTISESPNPVVIELLDTDGNVVDTGVAE